MDNQIYDVIIIGGGPAGLTAGLYAARARLKTLLIENPSVASQVIVTAFIENYPGFPEGIGGPDLIDKMRKQAVSVGLEIIEGAVNSIEKINQKFNIVLEDKTIESLSIIIATGAQPKLLNIPGEEKFKGRGVSYCAVCDGAFFRDKDIAVIGGGDTALDEALYLTRFAKNIKLIHRRDRLRATKILQEKTLKEKKIELVLGSIAEEILGTAAVEGVRIKNTLTNESKVILCSGIFIFVGYTPTTSFAKGLLKMNKGDYIIADDNMNTSCSGVFACGDCRSKILRQVVTACGDGATAAFSAQHYVEELKGIAYDSKKVC